MYIVDCSCTLHFVLLIVLIRPILFEFADRFTPLFDGFENYDLLSSISRQKMNKNSRKNYVSIVFSF